MSRRRNRNRSNAENTGIRRIGEANRRPKDEVKFMFASVGKCEIITLKELTEGRLPEAYEFAAQYMGIVDAEGTDVYQDDILELELTDVASMDPKFRTSNVGRAALSEPGAISVIAMMPHCGAPFDECCRVYLLCKGQELKRLHGVDIGFPAKFCSWGALSIGTALGYRSDRRALQDVMSHRCGDGSGMIGQVMEAI